MCDQETIEKIDRGEALVLKKIHLILAIIVIIVSFTTSYAITRYKTVDNEKRIEKLEGDHILIREIQANVKQLIEKNGLKYIEVKQ